jgi:hypothetical protein
LCLFSCIFGKNRDIFFPKLDDNLHLVSFADIAIKYLNELGYEPFICKDEAEARELMGSLPQEGRWPCLFTSSDTTGEKDFEEFYTDQEELDMQTYESFGVIKNEPLYDDKLLNNFSAKIDEFKQTFHYSKDEITKEFFKLIPNFDYTDKGKYLDSKM